MSQMPFLVHLYKLKSFKEILDVSCEMTEMLFKHFSYKLCYDLCCPVKMYVDLLKSVIKSTINRMIWLCRRSKLRQQK